MGIITLEKGKNEIGGRLTLFEKDLFDKGYKIVSSCYANINDELYVNVYDCDELFCKITHYWMTLEFEVTYYKNGIPIKTDWYLNGEKLNKSTSYYNGNGDKFIYYGSIKFPSNEIVLYKNNSGKREVISESDLSKYIPTDVINI